MVAPPFTPEVGATGTVPLLPWAGETTTVLTPGQAGDPGPPHTGAGLPGPVLTTVLVSTMVVGLFPGLMKVKVVCGAEEGWLETGQTVVDTGITTVVTEPRGQLVTDAGHLVTVPVEVV